MKCNVNRSYVGPAFVAGIGASAENADALESFFRGIGPGSEMAFILVQHVSPDHPSHWAEELIKRVGREAVRARSGMKVVPDRVHLVPPLYRAYLSNGRLRLERTVTTAKEPFPADKLFESLSAEYGDRVAGILFAGTYRSKTKGIRKLQEAGGRVYIQDRKTGAFSEIGGNAETPGKVAGLSPWALGIFLAGADHDAFLSDEIPESGSAEEQEKIAEVCTILARGSGIDFTPYKSSGVMRRVERRMGIRNVDNFDSYLDLLKSSTSEAEALKKDLLIGVTRFYRDPQAFEAVAGKVLPELVRNHLGEIRVWVAACSTGEEAYSLAILFKDAIREMEHPPQIKIFATDVDEEAIRYAARGLYPDSIGDYVTNERLERYFIRQGSFYLVTGDIRKMIVFSCHNLLSDPPFHNLHLISCRNMLIYMKPETQNRVLGLFRHTLREDGFLFLGPSDCVTRLGEAFAPVDRRWNVFRKVKDGATPKPDPSVGGDEREKINARIARAYSGFRNEPAGLGEIGEILQEHYLPSCLIVDEQDEIVHMAGSVSRFLSVAKGYPSHNIYRMVAPDLGVILGTGLHKSRKEHGDVSFRNICSKSDSGRRRFHLTIRPFPTPSRGGLSIVLFEEVDKAPTAGVHDEAETGEPLRMDQQIAQLGMELQVARDSLADTVEELEASNDELQSVNRALSTANEELQSTNEELQSVNVELMAVNAEFQQKFRELSDLNNDLDNFLSSSKVGTVFLDKEMRVRRFTPVITKEINLMSVDIGRPLGHISHNFKAASLVEDAEEVLNTLVPVEKEIESRSGRWYSLSILPYRTVDDEIKGVILSFVDISEIKLAGQELQKLSYAIEQSPSIILIANTDGIIDYVNPRFTEQTGYLSQEVVGRQIRELHPPVIREQTFSAIWNSVCTGTKWSGEMEMERKNGEIFWEGVSILPIKDPYGEIIQVLKMSQDITERKTTEELLRKSEMLSAVGQLAAGIAHEIRNPLTSLKGFTKLLEAGTSNKTYTQIMTTELDRIEAIISELLVLAKPQIWNFHRKDVIYVLRDVVMLLEAQAIMNNVEIVTSFASDIPTIPCVENQLKQVFINVLKNGIEAMPDGGKLTITAETEDNQYVRIRFVDEGCGIPEEKIPKLGEPFYSTKDKGTGLGLMVSFKIIENHKGKITIKSEADKGTVVDILLPLEK